jgi:hypothetical protein
MTAPETRNTKMAVNHEALAWYKIEIGNRTTVNSFSYTIYVYLRTAARKVIILVWKYWFIFQLFRTLCRNFKNERINIMKFPSSHYLCSFFTISFPSDDVIIVSIIACVTSSVNALSHSQTGTAMCHSHLKFCHIASEQLHCTFVSFDFCGIWAQIQVHQK